VGLMIFPFLSGWWQGEVLGGAIGSGLPILLALVALAAFSAAYATGRLVQVVFRDDTHSTSATGHRRSAWTLGKSLLVLAAVVVVGIALGVLPGGLDGTWFERTVTPAVESDPGVPLGSPALAAGLMALMIMILVAGWFTPLFLDRFRPERSGQLLLRLRGMYNLTVNRFWLDEIYDRAVIRPTIKLGHVLDRFDTEVIDRATGVPTTPRPVTTIPAASWEVEQPEVRAAGMGEGRGALGWLTKLSADTSGWVEREGIGHVSGGVGWLTGAISAMATTIERRLIDRGERVVVWLTDVTADLSAHTERLLFQTGIHVGVPRAGHGFGRILTRTEEILGRPAVIGSILIVSIIGVVAKAVL